MHVLRKDDERLMSAPPEDYVSTTEAAEQLGVAVRTVQLWVERGVLSAWKTPGGHRRIDAASLRRLLGERERATAGSGRILIVEDQPEQAEVLRLYVQNAVPGVEVQIARNGVAAMLAIGREPPSLLLLDLLMPEMDGFEVLRELASDSRLRQMRIVVVTALAPDEIAAHGGIPEEVAGVLAKPVDFDALRELVQQVVGTGPVAV
jgi:excisionase family DNA binding protein